MIGQRVKRSRKGKGQMVLYKKIKLLDRLCTFLIRNYIMNHDDVISMFESSAFFSNSGTFKVHVPWSVVKGQRNHVRFVRSSRLKTTYRRCLRRESLEIFVSLACDLSM